MSKFDETRRESLNAERQINSIVNRDSRQISRIVSTNHIGRTKPHKIPSRGRLLNHKRPRRQYVGKHSTFTNHGGALGMTDQEYRNFLETGKIPDRLKEQK